MKDQLVSIVIPTYNQPEYILKAVESALIQDYEHLEVVVSDDSLNNETETKLQEYINTRKIKYIRNSPRLGRVENYRKCLYEYAQGDWVLNLDGDDYLIDTEFISKSMEAIHKVKNIAFIIAGGTISCEDGTEIRKRIPGTKFPSRIIKGTTYFRNFALRRGFFHLTILYNAKKARNIDFYRMNLLSTDLESFLRLSLHGKVVLLDRNVGVWNLHSDNTSSNASLNEVIENLKWIDSVAEYAIKQKKLSKITVYSWNYLVKQQELTGIFIEKLKSTSSMNEQYEILKFILIKHTASFFFPVFWKKLFDFYILNK